MRHAVQAVVAKARLEPPELALGDAEPGLRPRCGYVQQAPPSASHFY